MIEGVVSDDGVPMISVEVGGERWRAIIDTGFNGELELPEGLRSRVSAEFVARASSLLAANQRIEEDVSSLISRSTAERVACKQPSPPATKS